VASEVAAGPFVVEGEEGGSASEVEEGHRLPLAVAEPKVVGEAAIALEAVPVEPTALLRLGVPQRRTCLVVAFGLDCSVPADARLLIHDAPPWHLS